MKKLQFHFSLICFIISLSFGTTYSQDTLRLIFDEPYNDSLPRNFRKCNGGFKRLYALMPDTAGLNGLNISGSSEFSDKNLPLIISNINKQKLIIIDLRQETHGFINGMDVSWYGKYDWADVGLTTGEVMRLEIHRLDSLKKAKNITVTKVLKKDKATDTFLEFQDVPLEVTSSQTEAELTNKYDVDYFRITATDHRQPTNTDVDRFVNFVTMLSGDYWLHFHCHAGDGRTTTFMVMYDMMKNAGSVSFDEIIMRQNYIGGINLSKDDDFPEWDKQYAIQRTAFLRNFYAYCKSNEDNFKMSFSAWQNK